jgi:hypothetical protein
MHIMEKVAKMAVAAALAVTLAAPGLAGAQQRYEVRNYDGYCYIKQSEAKRNGLILGAVAGGLLGSQVSKNERGLGAVLGAVVGGAVGQNIGKKSVKCYNGEYFAYQGRYYDPPRGPSGYVPVFYEQRPPSNMYSEVYYDRNRRAGPPPYSYQDNNNWRDGWRDSRGRWHDGKPPRGYWQDRDGYWHRR